MSKCSLIWSLSLFHAVLSHKSKIWLLIHHSCLTLLLITFLAVWGEHKDHDLPWLGRQHVLVRFVNIQQCTHCSWQLQTVDNIVEHLSRVERLRELGWFSLEKRKFRVGFQYLKGAYKNDGDGFLTRGCSDRKRGMDSNWKRVGLD